MEGVQTYGGIPACLFSHKAGFAISNDNDKNEIRMTISKSSENNTCNKIIQNNIHSLLHILSLDKLRIQI